MRISDWSSDVCSSDPSNIAASSSSARKGRRSNGQGTFSVRKAPAAEPHGAPGESRHAAAPVGASLEPADRKSVVVGKGVAVSVDLGGRRILKKKEKHKKCD